MNLMTTQGLPMDSRAAAPASGGAFVEARAAGYRWDAIRAELDDAGCAVLPNLLARDECRDIAAIYPHERHFRSQVIMARHGFGRGEYRYFSYPLPDSIGDLRRALLDRPGALARAWRATAGRGRTAGPP